MFGGVVVVVVAALALALAVGYLPVQDVCKAYVRENPHPK